MKPGERIGDRFEIEREASSGGMGTIYRARDRDGSPIALKVMQGTEQRERFEREALLLSELTHPGVVRYIAHGISDEGESYLAMEWLEGEDLAQRLAREIPSVAEAVAITLRISEALGAAHARGIVHRDVKPSNVFLEGKEVERVRVLDFGLARAARSAWHSSTGTTLGTPAYMAPEQARGAREVDARADVFSLGCVLFECVTGLPPACGENAMAILAKILFEDAPRASAMCAGVPEALDDLIARMLSKDPDARPRDARAVTSELELIAREAGPIDPALRSQRRGIVSGAHRTAITGVELRFASVVIVGEAASPLAQTLAPARAVVPDQLNQAARLFDARVEHMLDGSIVVALKAGGAATDQACRAAACAIELRRVVPDAPVAVATGRAAVSERLPLGEAIDRAASLVRTRGAGARKGAGILIDELTLGLLDEGFECIESESGAVLVGRRKVDAARTLLGKSTPCVGREPELGVLHAIVEQCLSEPVARAVLVTAPAGAGKSRVRHELLRKLESRERPLAVWLARADQTSAGSAFGLAAQMIRSTAGAHEGTHPAVRRERLRARVARHVRPEHRARVTTFLGEMIGARYSGAGDAELTAARGDSILMGDQIRRAFEDFVEAESAEQPLLIVLEDLHWGDRPTIGLCDSVLRLWPDRALMILAFGRPEVDELFPDLWRDRDAQRIHLGALPKRAAERLVRSVLQGASAEVVAGLVERAAGNAFYLEELIRFAAEGRGEALPETVLAMVQARLAAMEPDARRILRAASVFGEVFWESSVRALLGEDERLENTRRWLEELVRRELVVRREESRFEGTSEFAFRHALVRESAYAMLTESDRSLGHRLAAAWLEAAGEVDAMRLAGHLERGGDARAAARAFCRAAEQALEGNDLESVISRAERGITCLDGARASEPLGTAGANDNRDPLDEELGGALRLLQLEAHSWRGENTEGAARAAEVLALVPRGSDLWAECCRYWAVVLGRLGRVEELAACGDGCVAILTTDAPSTNVALAAAHICSLLFHVGLHELGRRVLAGVEAAMARLPPDIGLRTTLTNARAIQALHAGDTGKYVELLTVVTEGCRAMGAARLECAAFVNIGYGLLELGLFTEAVSALESGRATARRLGLRNIDAAARQNLGWAFAQQGRLEEARAMESEVAEEFERQNDPRMMAASRLYLSATLLLMGDLDGAEQEANRAMSASVGNVPMTSMSRVAVASALLAKGQTAPALEAARAAIELLREAGGLEAGEARALLVHAEAERAAGHEAAAKEAITRARTRLLERAAPLGERFRQSFLENIPEHARTLRLAAEWLGEASGD